MNVKKCDICGGIYDHKEQSRTLRIVHFNSNGKDPAHYLDLCPKHQKELTAFVHPDRPVPNDDDKPVAAD